MLLEIEENDRTHQDSWRKKHDVHVHRFTYFYLPKQERARDGRFGENGVYLNKDGKFQLLDREHEVQLEHKFLL